VNLILFYYLIFFFRKKEEVDIEPLTVGLVENKFPETNTLKPNFYSEPFTNNINVEGTIYFK